MKKALIVLLLSGAGAAPGATNDDAAVLSALAHGGRVIATDYGFSISSAGGTIRAVRQPQGGYWVSGPGVNARLIPRDCGYAVSPVRPLRDGTTVRPATLEDVFDNYYRGKRGRPKR
jgi:hypothetical protein